MAESNSAIGRRFVDVTNEKGPSTKEWNPSAPEWNIAKPGLFLRGPCTNTNCIANGRTVDINLGYGCLDILDSDYNCVCPMCKEGVEPVNCAFNRCEYKIECRQHVKYGVKPCYKVAVDWKSIGNKCQIFEPKEVGFANFLGIRISSKELPPCTICRAAMTYSEMQSVAKCGHTFHQKCYAQATSNGCIQCKANGAATSSGKTG